MRPTDSAQRNLEQLADAALVDLERSRSRIAAVFARVRSDSAYPVRGATFDPTGRHGGTTDPTGETAITWRADPLERTFGEWCSLNRELARKSYRLWQLTQQLGGIAPDLALELAYREHEQTGRCVDCGRVVARTKADPLIAGRCQAHYKAWQRSKQSGSA